MEKSTVDGFQEYWMQFHKMCCVVFTNIEINVNDDMSLKSLITSFLHLDSTTLSKVECLSEDKEGSSLKSTPWILHGLLKAASSPQFLKDQHLYIEAQTKLLNVTCYNGVQKFVSMIDLYMKALESVLNMKDGLHSKFLMLEDIQIEEHDLQLIALQFHVGVKNRIQFCLLLLKVITSVKDNIIQHFDKIHVKPWALVQVILTSGDVSLQKAVLPLLAAMLASLDVPQSLEVNSMLQSLCTVLTDPEFGEKAYLKDNFLCVWNNLKQACWCDNLNWDGVLGYLLKANIQCPMQDFIIKETSSLLAKSDDFNEVSDIVMQYENNLAHNMVHVLKNCVMADILTDVKKMSDGVDLSRCHRGRQDSVWVNVCEVSKTWSWILSKLLTITNEESDTVKQLSWINATVKVSCHIVGALEHEHSLSRCGVHYVFFGLDRFQHLMRKLTRYLHKQFPLKMLTMSYACLMDMLNLEETKNISKEVLLTYEEAVLIPLGVDELQPVTHELGEDVALSAQLVHSIQPLPSSVSYQYLLQCLRVPIVSKLDKRHAMQAVHSVPFLYLTQNRMPSNYFSDILHQAALTGDPELQLIVLDTIIDLVCALAETSYATRDLEGKLVLRCCECTGSCQPGGSEGTVLLVKEHLVQLLSVCATSKHTLVRLKMVDVMARTSMHLTAFRKWKNLSKFYILIRDEDVTIRRRFAQSLATLVFGRGAVQRSTSSRVVEDEMVVNDELCETLTELLSQLEEDVKANLWSPAHTSLQPYLLEAVSSIACFPVSKTLFKCLRVLLVHVGIPSAPVSAIFLKMVAAHRTTPFQLYYMFRPEISQLVGQLIVTNRLKYNHSLRHTLTSVMNLFHGVSEARFASGSEDYLVPMLLSLMVNYSQLEDLLNEWAEFCQQPVPVLLSNCFQSIYTFLLLTESTETFNKCMKFVEDTTNVKVTDFMVHSQKQITNRLLFNYHRAPLEVTQALKQVLCDKDDDDLLEKLESRLVGYLQFIVSKFVRKVNSDSLRVHAIQSLTGVIDLMGTKHVTPVARKVLATLQTTLTFDRREHRLIQVQLWQTFVTKLDSKELGPLLYTLVVCLTPFLTKLPDQVSKVFSYLIITNEQAVRDYLPSLIFLPEHPKLAPVKQKLKQYLNVEREELKERLRRETALAVHETVGVRVAGMRALQVTLRTRSTDVQNLIVGSDEPDPCIRELLDVLVQCCCDPDTNISMTAAYCLGQLGAVDPGLLPRELKPKHVLPLSAHDSEFAYLALTEMARAFQNARSSVDMDAFAIAIQELLKSYQITSSADNPIWTRFPSQVQTLITPMLSSYYKVQAPKRSQWPEVIFGSKDANTHLSWASLWASKLTGFCKDDRAVFIFSVCELSLKRDTKVLLFFLRYILLHAVLRDVSVHEAIIKEMEAVLNWTPSAAGQQSELAETRPIRLVEHSGLPNMRSCITAAEAQACALTVYLLLDFLQFWLRMYREANYKLSGDHLQRRDYLLVKDFIGKMDLLKVSSTSYEMRMYARSIMYLEDVITAAPDTLPTHLSKLSKAYALYGDLDSVAGSATFQKTAPTTEDLLLSHHVSGQMEELRVIYERLGKERLLTPSHTQEMAQCYLSLGEPFNALNCIESAVSKQPDMVSILSGNMAECLLKLGDYSQLDKFLESKDTPPQQDWYSQLGKVALCLHKDTLDMVDALLTDTQVLVVERLKVSGLHAGDYQQGYDGLVKLQILNEAETVVRLARTSSDSQATAVDEMLTEWTARAGLVQASPVYLEQLLSVRRIFLRILRSKLSEQLQVTVDSEMGKYWVKSAELARKARCFHQAYSYILSAEQYNVPLTFIEKAQLFWDKGDQDKCLFTLNQGIKEFFSELTPSTAASLPAGKEFEERQMCAEAKLLYAVYSEQTSNCDHTTNVANYRAAFKICPQLEKSQALLAQCLDRVASQLEASDSELKNVCDLKVSMVYHFGSSLVNGCEYIYQTVPRMLSVWLDMGEQPNCPEKKHAVSEINKLIQRFTEKLPPFILMTALPQLISRLGHPNKEVFQILKSILVTLIKAFPQQCLWAVQAVAKSSVPERVKRYSEVIQDQSLRSSGIYKLVNDFSTLCEKLSKLTNRSLHQNVASTGLTVSSMVRDLPLLFASDRFSDIIIPITRFCSISLPRKVSSSSHEPFPKHAVYIKGIKDEMTVLNSLQRPRKITLLGTDGKLYGILCKPKDDLRRDGRLMEFNNIVNMYLHREPESRARGLHIRTYVVTPLGEGGGILEWVPHLLGLRPALNKIYKYLGKYVEAKEIKKYECQARDPLNKKMAMFVNQLLPMHPPLLPEWFRLTFPDPADWFIARQSYTRTTAVMSMVGYILGLGDRHGENILIDTHSGDTVHVDFNCLFNKGEKFDWKERVPFRLTHNMVSAMGPFGVEGTFRKSCEISLRVLRSQTKTLMSVLTPFAYDPFGSWGKNKEIGQNERDQKIGEALVELSDIEKRLNGSLRVRQKNNAPFLSVEGQVRSLIIEATDIENLCQMYLGWGAYL